MSRDLSNLLYRKFNNETLPAKPERLFQNDFLQKQKDLLEVKYKKMMKQFESQEVMVGGKLHIHITINYTFEHSIHMYLLILIYI